MSPKATGYLPMDRTEVLKRYIDFEKDGMVDGETVVSAVCGSSTIAAATVSPTAICSGTKAHFTITGVAAGSTTLTITGVTSLGQTLTSKIGVTVS